MKVKLVQSDFLWKPTSENFGINIGFNVNYCNVRGNNYSGTWIIGFHFLFITYRLWFDECPQIKDIENV